MATDSFTSAANGVSSATATLYLPGAMRLSTHGFKVRINSAGVYVTKAPTFGGTQAALAYPLSKTDARELALLLLQMAT
jgi:hypothetical protein